jgi:hypothetical protein
MRYFHDVCFQFWYLNLFFLYITISGFFFSSGNKIFYFKLKNLLNNYLKDMIVKIHKDFDMVWVLELILFEITIFIDGSEFLLWLW